METLNTFNKPQDAVDHDIHELIQKRWSPRAFSEEALSQSHLNSLFESVRWAASSMNAQPWEFIYARRGEAGFDKIVETLMEGNKPWAKNASVLMVSMVRTKMDGGQRNGSAVHDLGLAIGNLSLQATHLGIGIHQMGGFFPDKVKELFKLPEDIKPVTAIALGYFGEPDNLDEPFRSREMAKRTRKKIDEFAFEGTYGNT